MKKKRFLILKVFYTEGKLSYFYAKETAILSTLRAFVNRGRVIEVIGFAELQFHSDFVSSLIPVGTLPKKNVFRKVMFSKEVQAYDKRDEELESVFNL